MRDLRLRFSEEATWTGLGISRDPGVLEIDLIGRFYDYPDGEGGETTELPGWHVNIRCDDDRDLSALDPWIVEPATPRRVWA